MGVVQPANFDGEAPIAQGEMFSKLLPASFRSVGFPVTKMRMRIAHELVKHAYWGVDGARIENTGLAPIEFSFSVPLVNGIVPGKSESWLPGRLYPDGMRSLVIMFARKETGILTHPEFGNVPVRAHTMDLDWSGDRRGGCECEMTFLQTLTDNAVNVLERESPIGELQLAAQDLDASWEDLVGLVPGLPKYASSFSDFLRAIAAIGDQTALLSARAAGKINAITYRVDAIQDSINRARSAQTWAATSAIERIKASTHDLRQKLLQAGRPVVLYVVPHDTTLAGVTVRLGDTTLGEVIKLNPGVMRSPVIPKGSVIRYYEAKVAA